MWEILEDPRFWTAVGFVVFIALVYKPIARAATEALDRRAEKIRADLEEAEKLREEAQDLLATYQRKQREAAREAEAILAHAREEAARRGEEAREKLEAALKRREELAVARIARAEAEALDEVRARAADTGLEAARKLLAERVSDEKADEMIEATIKELPKKLH